MVVLSRETPSAEPVLSADALTLTFGGVHALQDVSFDIAPAELVAVIGPNGAGKTSLLNSLSGFYRPSRGSVTFRGQELLGRKPNEIARHGLARMFQNIALFANLSVLQNMMLGRHRHLEYGALASLTRWGRSRREESRSRMVVEELVEFLEIEPYRHTPAGLLPYGIKKRVELGRALAMDPHLLLLDEPAAGMNVEESLDIARFIQELRADRQLPMLLIEHDMGLVMDLADRVLALDFGRVIAFGPPSEIRDNPAVVDAYLGGPQPGGASTPPADAQVAERSVAG